MKIQRLLRSRAALALALVADLLLYAGSQGPFDYSQASFAAALEQILETIESWNAQSLITGVCPGSESAIASLEASHLVLRKDLSEAIAAAFQISDAHGHLL